MDVTKNSDTNENDTKEKFDVESIRKKRVFNVMNVIYIDRIRRQDFAVPPFFKQHLRNILFDEDKVVKFSCHVGGVPPPEIEWYKGHDRIETAAEEDLSEFIGYKYYASMNDGMILFTVANISPEDLGPYTCKIKNVVGEARSTAVLYTQPESERKSRSSLRKDKRKVVIKEKITVVETKSSVDKRQVKRALPCNLPTGGDDINEISQPRYVAKNGSPQKRLMTVMFSVPDTCHTRKFEVKTFKRCEEILESSNVCLQPAKSTAAISRSEAQHPIAQNEETVHLEGNISPASETEMNSRAQWIQRGEQSDSEYRRYSIPYSLPRCLTETADDSTQPIFSQASVEETEVGNTNEWVTSWQRKCEVEQDRESDEESKDTFGRECRELFAIRGAFRYSTSRGHSEDRMEFNDVFENEAAHPARRENGEGLELSCEEGFATLQDVSPTSPDPAASRARYQEHEAILHGAIPPPKHDTCDGGAEIDGETQISIEEIVPQMSHPGLQCETPASSTFSFLEDHRCDGKVSDNERQSEIYDEQTEDPFKTLDDLIAMLLEFSQQDYVMVSSLKVGRTSKPVSSVDAKNVVPVAATAEEATRHGNFSVEPYKVQKMNVPMHPSDLTGESEDDFEPQKPKFVIPLQDMEVNSEDNIVLNVSVTGFPAPQISWYKNGEALNEEHVGEIHDDLNYKSATYTCVAKNSSGEAVTSATVLLNRAASKDEDATVENDQTKNHGVRLRQKTCVAKDEKRRSQIISASLVDYLRWKAKTLQQQQLGESIDEQVERSRTTSFSSTIEPTDGLTRDDVTLRRGSMLSLNSLSTTTFESADENFTSSDAAWEEVVSTCEEDFMSTDEFFFPGMQNDLARIRIPGFNHQAWDSDESISAPRPLTPTPVSEKPPFQYEITPTKSLRPFTRTSTETQLSIPDSSEGKATAPSGNVTPVPATDIEASQFHIDLNTRLPKFLVYLKDGNVPMSCTFALTCCLIGNPEPEVAWYRNGIKILSSGSSERTAPRPFPRSIAALDPNVGGPSPRFKITAVIKMDDCKDASYTTHTLTIVDCRLNDSGEYSIRAANEYGSATCKARISVTEDSEASTEQQQFSSPRFATKISDTDGMLGEEAAMIFELAGQPEPDISVLHKRKEVEGSKYALRKDENDRYTLTISNLQLDDEGEVRVCAINAVGYSECAAELFVDERSITPTPGKFEIPQWSDHTDDFEFGVTMDIRKQLTSQSTAPYFDDIADDSTTSPGDDASFAVSVYGWPAPDVSWYKDDEKITTKERFSVESTDFGTHVLTIRAVTEGDVGIYTCIAKNDIGQVSCKAELILSAKDTPASSSDDEAVKSILRRHIKDHYAVCGKIATGCFSTVRLVKSKSGDDNDYAGKYIRCANTEWRERYINEVRILKNLSHRNIVAYKDYFETKMHIILVLEYADREWFEHLLEKTEIKEQEIAKQVEQICSALQYLHSNRIVHLDMKPENIMVSENGSRIIVVDFGSAKELKNDDVFYDFGNPEFVSPEVVRALPVTSSSDMWSLGVISFVALCGNPPFLGESDFATVSQVKEGKFEFDKRWCATISEEAKDFVKRLIVLNPSLRMTAVESQTHRWINGPGSSCVFSGGRLKYFCSRRKWQRSLVGPKTSLTLRSISSLLKQEYDSASVAVPRNLMSDCRSSSTVTESEDESDHVITEPMPSSPRMRNDKPNVQCNPQYVKRMQLTSISIEDTIDFQKEPVTTPTLKITASSPELGRKSPGKGSVKEQPKIDARIRANAAHLSPIRPRDRLKMIGKKVSFEDEPSATFEPHEVESPVFQTAAEDIYFPPAVDTEVETDKLLPVVQMPEVSKPTIAAGPPGITLDRPQSVSKLLKEDRRVDSPRSAAEAENVKSTKEKIKKKLSLKSLRRHRSLDAKSPSSSSDDDDEKRSRKKDSSSATAKFSFFSRRKRPVSKDSSQDSVTGPPEEKKQEENENAEIESNQLQSSSQQTPAIKGILKRGGSSDTSSHNDHRLQKSFSNPGSPSLKLAANQESFFGHRQYQRRPLAKGVSLDLDIVAEGPVIYSEGTRPGYPQSATERRRVQMRRGSSVESALQRKPPSRISGLRGPLLEKSVDEDEPTVGMSLRRVITTESGSKDELPNHSRSYSGPLNLPSPIPQLSLSPRVPVSSPFLKYSALSRSFFSQSVDIAKTPESMATEQAFKGRKARSAQLPTSSIIALSRSRSHERQIGKRARNADKKRPGESYAPYLKAPLVDQGLTQSQAYATLSCLIDAFPQPEIIWYKDGEEISSSDRIEILSEPSISRYQLKIRNLSVPYDFGEYSCAARNAVGTVKTDCQMKLAVPPEKPSAPEFSGTDGTNVWITWNPPSNCPVSPMHYLLQYREMAAMKWVVVNDSIRDTLHKVENLRPTTSYRFRVRAINNAGVGPFSKVSPRIHLDPRAKMQALQYAF